MTFSHYFEEEHSWARVGFFYIISKFQYDFSCIGLSQIETAPWMDSAQSAQTVSLLGVSSGVNFQTPITRHTTVKPPQ